MGNENSSVNITINLVDGTSGAVVSQVVKNLDNLGEAGLRNGQKVKQGLAVVGSAGESVGQQAAKGLRQANGEMQQMVENIQRAQAKLAGSGQQRLSNPLGESFANIGTARANMEALGNSFSTLGAKGADGAAKAGRAVRGVGEHALTSLDNVRLLRDDLGIRIPRSMEKAIAGSKVLSGAIGALGSGFLALGAVELFIHIGEEVYHVYQRMTDVNAEMRKFAEESGRSANQELFNNSSLETTITLLAQVQQQKAVLEQQRSDAAVGADNSGSLLQYPRRLLSAVGEAVNPELSKEKGWSKPNPTFGPKEDQRLASVSADEEVLAKRTALQEQQRRVQEKQDALTHAGDGVEGRAATGAKQRAQRDLNEAQRQATQANELYEVATSKRARALEDAQNKLPVEQRTQIHQVSKDAGLYEQQRADRNADLEAVAANSKQSRTEGNEARHATAEAGMAGLEGEPLHLAQEKEELRQLSERAGQVGIAGEAYNALRGAIERKFIEARKKRISDEHAQTAQLDVEAGLGGLTGLAKQDQERAVKLAELARESKTFADPATLGKRTADINQQSSADESNSRESFSERLTQLDAGRADRYSSESDRITLSAQKTTAEITKAWNELYGQLAAGDARRVQGQQALNAEIARINADAARQRQEAGQRVEDETRKVEDEARRAGLPKYQQETAAIVDDYNERITKLEELRAKDASNADRYRRQEIAEEQIKNGKLLEQRRALEEQLAGKLRGLFNNPLEALKAQGEEQAAKAASQLLFKLNPGIAATVAGASGKGGGGLFGTPNIFGSGWGGKHPAHVEAGASQAGSGTHNDNPSARSLAKIEAASTSAMVTATTATITVGSATFSVAGSNAQPGRAGGATTGPYAATGGGSYFNTGSSGAGSSLGQITADAGSATGSTPGTFGGGVYDEAGASASTSDQIEAGVSTAQSAGSSIQSIGESLGKDPSGAIAGKLGLSDEAAGKLGGAAGGALGLFSAVEGKGGFGGALSGAMSGAQLGGLLGPEGALIGAGIGALVGFIGFGARSKAAQYDRKEVKPRIANGLTAFEAGQGDYTSAYADLESLTLDAKRQTQQMGRGAVGYYNDTILPEIKTAEQRLTREQKAGRSQFGMTAAQFHDGGMIRDFGSMATTGDQGWIHAQRGEMMLNQQAAMSHADAAMLMNAGASRNDMASYYGGGGGTRAADNSGGGDVHLHVHAIDTRGVTQFFEDNKHSLRASLNASYTENSGGGDYE